MENINETTITEWPGGVFPGDTLFQVEQNIQPVKIAYKDAIAAIYEAKTNEVPPEVVEGLVSDMLAVKGIYRTLKAERIGILNLFGMNRKGQPFPWSSQDRYIPPERRPKVVIPPHVTNMTI